MKKFNTIFLQAYYWKAVVLSHNVPKYFPFFNGGVKMILFLTK